MSVAWPSALLIAMVLQARPSAAAPNLWQRARDPRAAGQQRILNSVERLLSSLGNPELDGALADAAVAISQLGHNSWPCLSQGASSSAPRAESEFQLDARLEYLIGGALLNSRNDRESAARCMLERALRDAPSSPLAAQGFSNLAIAAAKLGDRVAEHAAYLRALALTWDPDSRGNLLANLAESEMALGNLTAAITNYRAALQSSQQPELIAGAYYGLAVALDRSGDLPSALAFARKAQAVPLPPSVYPVASVLDLPNVFFTPSYEVHYYKALGAMAAAESAKAPSERRDALADAAEQWSSYLIRAEFDHTPWAPRATLHRASVERKLRDLVGTPINRAAGAKASGAIPVL